MICSYREAFIFIVISSMCCLDALGCTGEEQECANATETEKSRSLDTSSNELKRFRRALNIPNPSKFVLEIDWSAPVSNVKGLTKLAFQTDLTFDLTSLNKDKTTTTTTTTTAAPATTPKSTYSKPKSSYSSHFATNRIETDPAEISRLDFYKHMENFLARRGYDGAECTLRTLCEFAEAPFEHGLYGELINMIMSASVNPAKAGGYDKYMTAEYYGKHYGDCGKIYPKCKQSVLDLFSKTF